MKEQNYSPVYRGLLPVMDDETIPNPGNIPADYARVRTFRSLSTLFNRDFLAHENLFLYRAPLTGNFNGLVQRLYEFYERDPLFEHEGKIALTSSGRPRAWWEDIKGLEAFSEEIAILREDEARAREESSGYIGTDLCLIAPSGYTDIVIQGFHADIKQDRPTKRLTRSYVGTTMEVLRNQDAVRVEFGHFPGNPRREIYESLRGAHPFNFHAGDYLMHRNPADEYPDPCVHRAQPSVTPRLVRTADYFID